MIGENFNEGPSEQRAVFKTPQFAGQLRSPVDGKDRIVLRDSRRSRIHNRRHEPQPVPRTSLLMSGEAKHLSLLPPFDGAITQSLDTNAPRQAAFNGGLDKVRGKEGQRDNAVHLPHAAFFARCDLIG